MIDLGLLAIGLVVTYLNIFPSRDEVIRDNLFPEDTLVQHFPDRRYSLVKRNSREGNHQKNFQGFPLFFGIQKYSVYTTHIAEGEPLGEISLACAFAYLCANTTQRTFTNAGEVTQVDLEVISVFRSVKAYTYRFYGKKGEMQNTQPFRK